MSRALAAMRRITVDVVADGVVFAIGAVLGLGALVHWLTGSPSLTLPVGCAVVMVVVMSRYPLILPQQAGDAVIGFEVSALVYLVLVVPPDEALGLWTVGQIAAQAMIRSRSWRSRTFNTGITGLGGALLVLVVDQGRRAGDTGARELAVVALACAAYFVADLLVTALSLSLEDRSPLSSALRWRTVPLPLLIFVAVATLGYLAALLSRSQSPWTLVLLLVPVVTILVATQAISNARLTTMRLKGLFDAATKAPDWTDDEEVETSLVQQARAIFRNSTAELRSEPPVGTEIGSQVVVAGRAPRWLVVARGKSHDVLEQADRSALETLTAVAAATLERRRLLDEMSFLARHDVLTGLHNRAVFTDRLEHALSSRRAHRVAVLYCDLDGFKAVNDRFGHETGDILLKAVAERLRVCVRVADTLARLGGDEFAILLDEPDDADEAPVVAQRILDALAAPFTLDSRSVRVRTSIGIARGHGGQSASDLLRNADTAMYKAKALGKERAELFHSSMQAENLQRIELQDELRRAVETRAITVEFQPVVLLATGRLDGFEVLARWRHEQLGDIGPDVFVPLAEQMGLGTELGELVLDHVEATAAGLCAAAGRPVCLGVNLTPGQATEPRMLARVVRMRERHPDVPLILEITEGALLDDDASTMEALTALTATGARLAVDDFGVGYSSIGYLHRFPIDILKIDKSFVQDSHEPRTQPLVSGMVAMSREMGLVVVAEGIEDAATAERIRDMGCHLGQGYLFARPLPLAAAMDLARDGVDSPLTSGHRPLRAVASEGASAG